MSSSNIELLHTISIIDRSNCFSLKVDGINVGKCIIKKIRGQVWLQYIEIQEKYRGNDYSTILWNLVENWLKEQKINKIYLYTSEFADRQGKLEQLYNGWGFQKMSTLDNYEYNGDYLIRKIMMMKTISE